MSVVTMDCHSSFLGEAVYFSTKQVLRLTIGGTWYYYHGVTKQKFSRFRSARSRGQYYCTYIKGKYETTKRKVRS